MSKGQTRIILDKLGSHLVPDSLCHGSSSLDCFSAWEEENQRGFMIYGLGDHLGHVTKAIEKYFRKTDSWRLNWLKSVQPRRHPITFSLRWGCGGVWKYVMDCQAIFIREKLTVWFMAFSTWFLADSVKKNKAQYTKHTLPVDLPIALPGFFQQIKVPSRNLRKLIFALEIACIL